MDPIATKRCFLKYRNFVADFTIFFACHLGGLAGLHQASITPPYIYLYIEVSLHFNSHKTFLIKFRKPLFFACKDFKEAIVPCGKGARLEYS